MRRLPKIRTVCNLVFFLTGLAFSVPGAMWAQVADADCFSGNCNGTPGIPECPDDFEEVGFITYANNQANEAEDCVTVTSCTNFNSNPIALSCRFYHGFNSIPAGETAEGALCSTLTELVDIGNTTECATDADEAFRAGTIFGGAGGNCPTFEGKGLVCARSIEEGDRIDTDRVICHVHLSCGNGTVLENITFVPDVFDDDIRGHHRNSKGKGEDD